MIHCLRVHLSLACLLAVGLIAAPKVDAAATASERFQALLARMHQAYSHSQWKEYRAGSTELTDFLNGSPDALLELARASARTGDSRAAVQDLEAMARMGVSQPRVGTLADFAGLHSRPDFRSVLREMATNARPISHSSRAFVISDRGLLPEDIAYDPASGEFLLTSVLEARIVGVTPRGQTRTFARAPDGWPMLAIKVDRARQVLWATEVALTGFRSVPRRDWGRSVILEYDLRGGRLLRSIEGPRKSQLGDMALSPAGDLLASDSNGGGLYLLQRGSRELSRLPTNDFVSPMTPAFLARHQAIIADYVRGIGLLDLITYRVTWLPMDGKYALQGTDGLYWYHERLIAVQNGFSPQRVLSFKLDAAHARISGQQVIESGTPALDPTHSVVVSGSLYYIANAGWSQLTDDGAVRHGAKLTPAIVMRTRL
jgi:hypothetical protein